MSTLFGHRRALPELGSSNCNVRALKRKNIRAAAVFMGESEAAGSAEMIYVKNLARIRSMDQLARAAGILIQSEIREIDD